ncbi:hypothetical protein IMZ48_02350 [Candidatus Bathyarchaeota archaeon]|nr:hypothetical protein [Candidatus Bathyarchaeota archaeon]
MKPEQNTKAARLFNKPNSLPSQTRIIRIKPLPSARAMIDLQLNRFPAYISRLPPCTRVLILATVLASLVDLVGIVNVQAFGALVPDKISIFAGESTSADDSVFIWRVMDGSGRERERDES